MAVSPIYLDRVDEPERGTLLFTYGLWDSGDDGRWYQIVVGVNEEGVFQRTLVEYEDSDAEYKEGPVHVNPKIETESEPRSAIDDAFEALSIWKVMPFYEREIEYRRDWRAKERLLSSYGERTAPADFYDDLFPHGSFERKGHPEDGRPNAMVVSMKRRRDGGEYPVVSRVYDGHEAIDELQGDRFAFMSPIGYIGKERTADNARKIYALVFDLDGIDARKLENGLLHEFDSGFNPRPTYIVNSGHGLHLYYIFDEPLDAYPNVQRGLKSIKYSILPRVWNRYTSNLEEVQKQGVVQAFRVVGTQSKLGCDYPVTAFKTGPHVTVDYLLGFCDDASAAEAREQLPKPKGKVPLEVARGLYPDWYERVIVKKLPPKKWHVKRDLYDWWKRKLESGRDIIVGNRYFCIMTLAIFAVKCDIGQEELERDAFGFLPMFDSITKEPDEHFFEEDVMAALGAYAERYATFPKKDIEAVTHIAMPPSVPRRPKGKRLKQDAHLAGARAVQQVRDQYAGTDWREGNGRPKGSPNKRHPKRDAILAYKSEHPQATQREIADALGCSKTTVNKWLNA